MARRSISTIRRDYCSPVMSATVPIFWKGRLGQERMSGMEAQTIEELETQTGEFEEVERLFREESQLLVIGIYCGTCKRKHEVPGAPVHLAKGDSIRMICPVHKVVTVFKIEKGH